MQSEIVRAAPVANQARQVQAREKRLNVLWRVGFAESMGSRILYDWPFLWSAAAGRG